MRYRLNAIAIVVVAVILAIPMVSETESMAWTTNVVSDSGSGTIDDPYVGSVTMESVDGFSETDVYLEVGCTVSISIESSSCYVSFTDTTELSMTSTGSEYVIAGTSNHVSDHVIGYISSIDYQLYHSTTLHFIRSGSNITGSGTEDDPYRGDFTGGGWTYLDLQDKYVEVGSIIDIYIGLRGSSSVSNIVGDMDPGLSSYSGSTVNRQYMTYIQGELTQLGDIQFQTTDTVYSTCTSLTWTLHVVDAYPELEFLSDPNTDGTVIYAG